MFVPLGQNLTGNRNPEFWRARFSFDEQVMSSLDLFGGERFTVGSRIKSSSEQVSRRSTGA